MRITIIAAATAVLAFAPLAANAQATGEKMQGSPNAAGMSKGEKADANSPSAEQAPSDKMKGPPNADGAAKDGGKKD